jgi:hypothetical protein
VQVHMRACLCAHHLHLARAVASVFRDSLWAGAHHQAQLLLYACLRLRAAANCMQRWCVAALTRPLSDLSHLLPACACWMCCCMVS